MNFFTATINNWQLLLLDDNLKRTITDSLQWLHDVNRARTHGFVVMPNHMHLLWTPTEKFSADEIENMLLSFTAHEFKKYLRRKNPSLLENYVSTQEDRQFHFWERRSRTMEVKSREIAEQKLTYMHLNPMKDRWNLVETPEQYYFSSAAFYLLDKKVFPFLTHYMDYI